jgi:hypothetical protein
MQTKSSTKKARKGSAPTKAEQRAQLASDISSILMNPQTPAALYNAIADEITTWSSDYLRQIQDTAAYIESCLDYYHAQEAKRTKGGAR